MDMRRRLSTDGAGVTRADPGTPDTDPEYYATAPVSVTATGGVWIDLVSHTFTGAEEVYLQSIYMQTKGHEEGDMVEIVFRSDGTQEQSFGPTDTEVRSFGTMNVPLAAHSNGWSPRIEEPGVKVGSAKRVYPGLKVSLLYTAVTVAERRVVVDLVMQE